MIEYFIESIVCGAVLYLAFLAFFRRSRSYQVNRILLVCSVLFFVLVPFIQFSSDSSLIKEITTNEVVSNTLSDISNFSGHTMAITESLNSTWGFSSFITLYAIIAVLLLGRLCFNLSSFLSEKFVVERRIYESHRLALVNMEVSPFSFFKTVYLNKESFENGEIDDELIRHETAHIKQMHTLDILFIELIQVFCWFNPFIFLFKRLIKTNHEYLADEFVVHSGSNKTEYSNKLINYTTRDKTLALASGFNYSLIKNRLIMLSKYDQRNRIGHRLTLFAAIIAGLFITTAFTSPDPDISLNESSGYFYADTIFWSSETQKVQVRGDVDIKVGDNDINGRGTFSFLGEVNILVIDGAQATMDEAVLVTGKKCEVFILSEEDAKELYGDEGKNGAVIIKTAE